MHIVVFGGGMQGCVIARNLKSREEKPRITVADIRRPTHLPRGVDFIETVVLDEKQVEKVQENVDTAVLAVPSQIARAALQNILKTGVAVVDVCFTPEPPLDLDALARKNGACCVIDCGIAPGVSHILAGNDFNEFGNLDDIKIYVGGIPQAPPAVFHHAIYFNPSDLVSEYIRPARAREAGVDIAPDPLKAEVHSFRDEELGDLEAFLSDGLRTLLTSFPQVPNMSERTLRHAGHLKTMADLEALGLFEEDTVDNTAKALGNRYPAESYPDYLLMQVEAYSGSRSKSWRLLDRARDGESAMSRTTGYTTAAVAMVLARKQFSEPSVHAPERLGAESKITETILQDLARRNIEVKEIVYKR